MGVRVSYASLEDGVGKRASYWDVALFQSSVRIFCSK